MQQQYHRGEAAAGQVCFEGCCPTPLLGLVLPEPRTSSASTRPRSSTSVSRRDFAAAASSSIFPNAQFTNHESLPSLAESYAEFAGVYLQYVETDRIDRIRAREYFHLDACSYTCLDYIGIGLFSYHQLHTNCDPADEASSSRAPGSDFPFFSISYKTGDLKSQLLLDDGGQVSELESSMTKRIMAFLNISDADYSMVFTANRTAAFKLVAESYPFRSSRKLLTVYDYESEAVEAMINSSEQRGAKAMSAEFTWPRLRIHAAKLKSMVVRKKKKDKQRGLFVFPVHSRVTGARYPYLWMNMARENGWHVLLDACALGPKDMDSFGLSLFRPDFIVSSLYKVFGENPSGFGCLFVKKSAIPILETSTSLGIVSLIPAIEKKLLRLPGESSDDFSNSNSFSGPIPVQMEIGVLKPHPPQVSSSTEQNKPENSITHGIISNGNSVEIRCDGLDHVDSLGMILIGNRGRCLINWLVNALLKLEHPNREGARLVRIYGPKIKFDRGPALAFNVFDWKGEKVEPPLVQKLADRSNISLSYGYLHHIWFTDKYADEKTDVLEKRTKGMASATGTGNRKEKADQVIMVVTLALSFLTNFEDVYKLWAFVAQFLDADFVEKERWRYTALNQKTVEV